MDLNSEQISGTPISGDLLLSRVELPRVTISIFFYFYRAVFAGLFNSQHLFYCVSASRMSESSDTSEIARQQLLRGYPSVNLGHRLDGIDKHDKCRQAI